jgi:hypothetical protein
MRAQRPMGGLPCPRIWQGGRRTAPKMKGSAHEFKKNGSKVLPGLLQRRSGGGGETSSEEAREITSPMLCPSRTTPHLVTFMVDRWDLASTHQVKCPRVDAGKASSLPS